MFDTKEESILQNKFDQIGEVGEKLGSRVNFCMFTLTKRILLIISFLTVGGLTFIYSFSHGLIKNKSK